MSDLSRPRDAFRLEGLEAAEQAFLQAMDRGRLHHAWLLCGPEGVGKATLAFRVARRLLGAAPDSAFGPLGSSPDHTVSRQISARAHPDLMVVERLGDDGKMRRQIPVEEARRLPEFFSKSPGEASYRVAIIDAADDLNQQGANAVLKTLEEPPERGVLLLVAHQPGALLPTIRSRCRRLVIAPPPESVAAAMVARTADLNAEDALRLVRMGRGAPGRALRLHAVGALAIDDAARAVVNGLPRVDYQAMLALTDGFRGGEGTERFRIFIERLSDRIHALVVHRALEGTDTGLEDWARAWETLQTLPAQVEGLNLDKGDALWTALGQLRRVA